MRDSERSVPVIAAALNVGGEVGHDWSVMLFFVLAASLGTFTTLYFYVFSFQ